MRSQESLEAEKLAYAALKEIRQKARADFHSEVWPIVEKALSAKHPKFARSCLPIAEEAYMAGAEFGVVEVMSILYREGKKQ